MILIYSLTLNTNPNYLFAKQIKTFIRKINGEVRIPPTVAANLTALSPAFQQCLAAIAFSNMVGLEVTPLSPLATSF